MTQSRDTSTAVPESPTDDATVDATPLDPASLADDPGVAFAERVYPHGDTDHCEAGAAARAVVGCTRDDGAVLLLVNRDAEHAILPHPTVDDVADLHEAAREEVADVAGIAPEAVSIGAPVAVRRVAHYVTDDPDAVGDDTEVEDLAIDVPDRDPHNVTHHVVLAASLARDGAADLPTPGVDDPDWEAGWFQDLPVEMGADAGDVTEDLRRFFD